MAEPENPQKQTTEDQPQAASSEELQVAFAGPAPFVNKFYLIASGPVARIVFSEQLADQMPIFRTAIVMTVEDLMKLGKLIQEISASAKQLFPLEAGKPIDG